MKRSDLAGWLVAGCILLAAAAYIWSLPVPRARVVGGPAPWQLAALPLNLAGDAIVVAGPFVGRLCFAQPAGGPSGP